ncbi:MAG: hypothetical protein WC869_11865 [Phycisphaerae bacterium]|jgi:hypothetical protein
MSAVEITTSTYTSTMSSVLRRVFDGCAKKVANFAGCNVETAKNWLEGRNAPNGALLIRMIRESDDVLAAVLELAERPKEAKKVRATAVLRQLEAILGDEE